jgi:hypothetical protein
MASKNRDPQRSTVERSTEYVKGGRGRKDDVRGSGIYPTSSANAPSDAEVRTEGDLVKHKGPKNRQPR